MKINVIYEDRELIVVDKPPGIVVYSGKEANKKSLIDYLLMIRPNLKKVGKAPRYGIVHRLDKDTSGLLLIAKSNQSLTFLQNEFKERKVEKKYVALVVGTIKEKFGTIETLIGRSKKDRRKQKTYLPNEPGPTGKREARTYYKIIRNFKDYTLIEAIPKTGRKHQIRVHLAYILHPIAGDKVYGFKNQPCPNGLKRQFLHSGYLKIELIDGQTKEFISPLPKDLDIIINKLKKEN